jgi:hypothetical protein
MQGIMFTEPNFHEVLAENKNMTRRIAKAKGLVLNAETVDFPIWGHDEREIPCVTFCLAGCSEMIDVYPRYQIGEKVYLKEPYAEAYNGYVHEYEPSDILLKLSKEEIKWKNKMFMPASAARYLIEINNIKVELLQDISDEDCMKEGIKNGIKYNLGLPFLRYTYPGNDTFYKTPREAYAAEIDKINGNGTWDSNPYMFAYEFELIKE